jgi:hypothetical protein
MELRKVDVARRVTSCVSAQEYSFAMCAWVVFIKNFMHYYDLLSRHVSFLPGAVV